MALRTLLTWSAEHGRDVEQILLSGRPLPSRDIRAFAHWLENRIAKEFGVVPRGARTTFNTTLANVRMLEGWFVEMYWPGEADATRARDVMQTLEAQAGTWKGVKKK